MAVTGTPTAAPVIVEAIDPSVVELIDDGQNFSYKCAKVVEDNDATLIPMTFFMDLSFPEGAEKLALRHVQEQLVTSIAGQYGVSNGQGCESPSNGKAWVIEISSELSDWVRDPVLESCKELTFNKTTEECFAYEARVTSGVLAGSAADVMEFIESQLVQGGNASAASVTQNSPYQVQFLGFPQIDPTTGDTDRNNLGTPTSVNEGTVAVSAERRGDNFTVVGGILIAAFCIVFVGVGLIIHRRRQEWLREKRETAMNYDSNRQEQRHSAEDDEPGQRELYGTDDHLQMNRNGQVMRSSRDDSEHEKITIDMGSNFKDQLMGVYGSSAAQRRLQQQQRNSLYGSGRGASMDSEADSWAQTDGTIGSIEQNLEPITSEV